MKISTIIVGLFLLFLGSPALAQETFPRNDVKDVRSGQFAFTNATIVVDYQTTLPNATLLIKGGRVEQVGANVSIPAGYTSLT
jgi:hypothetical protein